MAAKYQVFISSTFEDLKEERDQVIRAVLEMGHIPVGMEMFSAADEEQWRIIQRHIDESDYYVVLVAHRLGSLTGGISYTRKEYEYATMLGVPVLGFLLEEGAPWPADGVDRGPSEVRMLGEFKTLIRSKPVSFWRSVEDLYGRFSVALTKAITANPREGWVRASSVAGPEVATELTRLSSENARLREEIAVREARAGVEHEAEIARLLSELQMAPLTLSYRYRGDRKNWVETEGATHELAFSTLAPIMAIETTIRKAMSELAFHLRSDTDRNADYVAINQVRDLFATWSALGLVEPSSRKHQVSDNEEYWSLATKGREVQALQRRRDWARKLSDPQDPPGEAGDGVEATAALERETEAVR